MTADLEKLAKGLVMNKDGVVSLSLAEIKSISNQPETIELGTVISSNIQAIGYHEESHTVEIAYANGSRYRYLGVPTETMATLKTAESAGRAVTQLLKGRHGYFRVA